MVDSSKDTKDSINKPGMSAGEGEILNVEIVSATWNVVLKRLVTLISELSGLPVRPIVFTVIDKLVDGASGTDNRESKDNNSKNAHILHQLAVVNLYYREQVKQFRLISGSCLVSALSIGVLNYFSPTLMPAASNVMIALLALFVLVYVRILLIAYRISKGYFGNNRPELSSLIAFVIDKSDDIDSSGGDQFKLVYPQIDQSQESQVIEGLEGLGA